MKEKFSIQLTAVDCIPVLLFSVTSFVLAGKLRNPLFMIGAVLCVCAGLGKVIWKLLIALKDKDVRFLGAQLRYVMPAGFLLMIVGAVQSEATSQLLKQAGKMMRPAVSATKVSRPTMMADSEVRERSFLR